jgi:hypothetical protein
MFTQTLPTRPSPASAAARHRDHVLHIQRVWRRKFRHNQTHQLVADFFEHGPTTDRVKGMRFVLVSCVWFCCLICYVSFSLIRCGI